MEPLWQDLRFGLRMLAKNPGFTAVAVITLALGIGANTAIFSVVNTVLLKPLPYAEPDRLVMVRDIQQQLDDAPGSYPEFLDWKEQEQIFDGVAAYFHSVVILTGRGEPERVNGVRVSANLLPLLGVNPALGRGFLPEEEPPDSERVALISYSLWQRRFGGNPEVIGQSITLNQQSTTVIGVLPTGFRDKLPWDIRAGRGRDVWLPLRLDRERASRGLHWLTVLGRLRDGLSFSQARTEMEAVGERFREDGRTRHLVTLAELRERVVGDVRPALMVLLGAVGFVLLIACANVANLLLARASARQREIAVRLALGASRARLIRQLVTESMLLAVTGGALGLLLSGWALRVFAASGTARLPRLEQLSIDGTVLGFTLAATLLTGLLFGVAPAFQATAAHLQEALKEGGRQPSAGLSRHRTRSLLVIAEVALSFMLLIGAGLLIRSFVRLANVEMGFDPEKIINIGLSLPNSKYPEAWQQVAFFDQVLERVAALPGVEGAAVVNSQPLEGGPNGSFTIEGVTWPAGDDPLAEKRMVSPDYFQVMRIPLLQGRFFGSQDTSESLPAIIINREFARRYFPNENPLGKRVDFAWSTSGFQEIVGVVGDVKQDDLASPTNPAMYVPHSQRTLSGMTLAIRTAADPQSLIAAIRAQVRAVDPDQAMSRVRTMTEVVSGTLAQRKFSMVLLGAFAGLALFLAMMGIYGVMNYAVTQRTQEVGIRMALGAQAQDILKLVVNQGMALTLSGVAVGLLGAFALTRFLAASLFGIAPTDPLTFAGVALLLVLVALLACYVPARRATKVDPMVALRYE